MSEELAVSELARVEALLSGWQALTDKATPGEWTAAYMPLIEKPYCGRHDGGDYSQQICLCTNAAEDEQIERDSSFVYQSRTAVPMLLAAVQGVLDLHQPVEAINYRYSPPRPARVCAACGTDDGNWNLFPCATVRAVVAALGGEA